MVNRILIRGLDAGSDNWEQEIEAAIGSEDAQLLVAPSAEFSPSQIISGRVLRVDPEFVLVDVGYKSEGIIPRREWDDDEDEPEVGQTVDVLIEEIEDAPGGELVMQGMILLSKRKAKKMQEWEKVMSSVKEGDVVTGVANRKIKGGLLVDIGVNVFLPASQVDIRRPQDIGEYLGRTIQCKVLKIDDARRNIVVSRRALIEDEREEKKSSLLKNLEVGQLRTGIVKNIADFGAFVDLGGLDGLLHITDMSWGRIGHPSEMVSIDQEIEVKILNIDYKKEKIALGLKQKSPSPWEQVAAKYPVGSVVKGTVVNVMSYGAFVKLEDGIEGLVHISEMSWTRRVKHPSDILKPDDWLEAVVLDVQPGEKRISLGLRQTQADPFERAPKRYPIGQTVRGRVRTLTDFGAFVEVEPGIEGLVHHSELSWDRGVKKPAQVLKRGQEVTAKVLKVDAQNRRLSLSIKGVTPDPWIAFVAQVQPGAVLKGKIVRRTDFGAFVELAPGVEGLCHVTELPADAEESAKAGEEHEFRVLKVSPNERRISLSLRSELDRKAVQQFAGQGRGSATLEEILTAKLQNSGTGKS